MVTQNLVYLVVCAVNQTAPDSEQVAAMDLDAVYRLALRHMLVATVAPALEAAGVSDNRFSKALKRSFMRNVTMDTEMMVLFSELDAAGIWHMPLKGVVLQHIYPVYGMRQMSDRDILFDARRADDVRAIMEGEGFSAERFGAGNHDVYYKEPVSNFEMHRTLFGTGAGERLYEYYEHVEGRLRGDGFEKHLSPEDFYLYVTAHEYKHYSHSGTGLRSLLDVYLYLRMVELDMDYVETEALKLGMAGFEAANRALAQRLFSGQELTEADKEMLEYVVSSGAYGTMDHRVENAIAKNGHGKLRYMIDRFCVPVSRNNKDYADFAVTYPLFYRYKVLLPLLPFYRTLRAMRAGRFKMEARAIKDAKS